MLEYRLDSGRLGAMLGRVLDSAGGYPQLSLFSSVRAPTAATGRFNTNHGTGGRSKAAL